MWIRTLRRSYTTWGTKSTSPGQLSWRENFGANIPVDGFSHFSFVCENRGIAWNCAKNSYALQPKPQRLTPWEIWYLLTLGRLANYNQFHACSNLFIISCDKSTCGPPARCSWQHPSPSAPLVASDSQKTHKSMRGCPENVGMNHLTRYVIHVQYIYIIYLFV